MVRPTLNVTEGARLLDARTVGSGITSRGRLRELKVRIIMQQQIKHLYAALLVALTLSTPVSAQSSQEIVSATRINTANNLLREGKVAEALADYQQVQPTDSDRDTLNYNLAVAEYRSGNIDAARTRFTESSGSANALLASASRYNLGNCFYSDALRTAEQDKAAAIESLRTAISHFRGSLVGNPNNIDARANIELAGELLRKLKREQKQAEQEQKQGKTDQPQDQKSSQPQNQDQQNQDQQNQDQQQADRNESSHQQQNQEDKTPADSPAGQTEKNDDQSRGQQQDQTGGNGEKTEEHEQSSGADSKAKDQPSGSEQDKPGPQDESVKDSNDQQPGQGDSRPSEQQSTAAVGAGRRPGSRSSMPSRKRLLASSHRMNPRSKIRPMGQRKPFQPVS